MAKLPDSQPYRFSGFVLPQYTQVPDQLFDELLPRLSESELKVLLYIIRRTFGFKKASDNISLKQLVEGITTRDGRRLDYGAGVSKTSAVRGVNGLVEKNVIVAVRNRSTTKGDEPTTYQLQMLGKPVSKSDTRVGEGVSTFETRGGVNLGLPRDPNLDTQKTVEQQTASQSEPFEISKETSHNFDEIGTRTVLVDYLSGPSGNFMGGLATTQALELRREQGVAPS